VNLLRSRLASLAYLSGLVLVALIVLSALPQYAAPQPSSGELVFELDPAQSKVHWTLGSTFHTVHGTFALKKGTLHLDPVTGNASGEIVVDAASGNSGNDGRDRKMHKEVLESRRYPEIVFRPDHVEGKIVSQGIFTVRLHGILVLHGTEHESTVPVQAQLVGDHWACTATLAVPFIDWGLKNPSNFFLKVNRSVQVELELKGRLQSSAPQS
jgi:polyisoprenoid-binding protein YceI